MGSGIILFGAIFIAGFIVQQKFTAVFRKNANIYIRSRLSGREVAEKMLYSNGILDVKVTCVEGVLTDHYNPQSRSVNLSREVYEGRSIASAAVAAHECGHAIQHKTGYAMLEFRSAIVPIVSITSQWVQWVLLAGVILINVFPMLFILGIAMLAFSVLFSVITLPVEYDASNRALVWLRSAQVITYDETEGAAESLRWAARTYLVAAISSIAMLVYYLGFLKRNS